MAKKKKKQHKKHIKIKQDGLINDLSAEWLFDTDLCSKANHIKCIFNDTGDEKQRAASFVQMGSVKWDGWQGDREDVCHSFKGNTTAARCTVALREEEEKKKKRKEREEEGEREREREGNHYLRKSRWKWTREDENWEKELGIVVGEAECEKKREGRREPEEDESIWKLVVLMAK